MKSLVVAALCTLTLTTMTGVARAADTIVDTPIATIGCGQAPPIAPGGTAAQTITSGGVQREYVLHLPADYDSRAAQALVLVLHGRGKSDDSQATVTAIDQANTIAVYPQGLPGTKGESAWPGAPYSTAAQDGDPQFISDLITHLQQTLCVDATRIMLAGKSNGGGFVGLLACTMSQRIVAVAIVSGAFYGQHGCTPDRPIPVLDFHGTGDTTIPYDGDADRDLPAIPDWLSQWAAQNRCHHGPQTFFVKDDVTGLRWVGCHNGATVVHYRITGGGHVWPGGTSEGATQTISATDLLVQFLWTHPLDG